MKKKYSFSIAWTALFIGGMICRVLDGYELTFTENYLFLVIPLVAFFFLGWSWDEMEAM